MTHQLGVYVPLRALFLVDEQLSIHYNYNHMIHLPNILETFEPVTPPPPSLISNTTTAVGSQFQFLRFLKCMLLIYSTLCGFCRPFCAYKIHYKHSKSILVIQSIPVNEHTLQNWIGVRLIRAFSDPKSLLIDLIDGLFTQYGFAAREDSG